MSQTDTAAVYKVIQLVATHPEGWEQAAAVGIAEATKTIRELRVAQVVELDTTIADGATRYRVKLKISFRIDRFRLTESGERFEVKRYLVVANQTVGRQELNQAIEERIGRGPAEFHVLIPATYSSEYATARRLAGFGADPTSGYAVTDAGLFLPSDTEGLRQAHERLDAQTAALEGLVEDVTGEVGDPDPVEAIAAVLDRGSFDEILLSTLPAGMSRWLGLDLPSRIARRFRLPTIHVEAATDR